jgi:tRNA(adenine34) deaminase
MKKPLCRCGEAHTTKLSRRFTLRLLAGGGLAGIGLYCSGVRAKAREEAPRPEDQRFMRMAIAEAAKGDFPFGAVIVRNNEVLSTGRNLGKTTNDPTAHGEMIAIRRFVAVYPAAELKGTTLYTSGEPCPMCMSAIIWCGISRVVFAASIEELSKKLGQIMLRSRTVAQDAPFADISITGGVLAQEALALFR